METGFKTILRLICLVVIVLTSCTKEEPKIDYTGEAMLYRLGDDSFIKELDKDYLTVRTQPFSFAGIFNNNTKEVFILEMKGPSYYNLSPGSFITPSEVIFGNPYYLAHLGSTRKIESGYIKYVGATASGGIILRFIDLTFKCKRTDDSGIEDTYFIRGTVTYDK